MAASLPTLRDASPIVRQTETADALMALADKAIQRVTFGRMTELMPEDVRLIQRAARELREAARLAA